MKDFMTCGLQFTKKMDGWLGKSRLEWIKWWSLTLQVLFLDHFIGQITYMSLYEQTPQHFRGLNSPHIYSWNAFSLQVGDS